VTGQEELLTLLHPQVTDAPALLRTMAGRARDAGLVGEGFADAVVAREEQFPTGLPTPVPAAIPHTDPVHVRRPGRVVALLRDPVDFVEMGSTDRYVSVRLVVMLLVDDPQAQVEVLGATIAALQDPGLAARLDGVRGPDDLAAALRGATGSVRSVAVGGGW
jgi:PTS system galactitol-specific IIA component